MKEAMKTVGGGLIGFALFPTPDDGTIIVPASMMILGLILIVVSEKM